MRKTILGLLPLLIVFFFADSIFSQQEVEREYVRVVNVEMLVRVMKDGRPLAGLKKGDFTL
ncbi:MAG TPA: hypothetical protein VF451_00710, partial [Acidobacteriota bacterium]